MKSIKFSVYGRDILVVDNDSGWTAFYPGTEGKRRPATDIVIPPDLPEEELAQYLEDLCHEWASNQSTIEELEKENSKLLDDVLKFQRIANAKKSYHLGYAYDKSKQHIKELKNIIEGLVGENHKLREKEKRIDELTEFVERVAADNNPDNFWQVDAIILLKGENET